MKLLYALEENIGTEEKIKVTLKKKEKKRKVKMKIGKTKYKLKARNKKNDRKKVKKRHNSRIECQYMIRFCEKRRAHGRQTLLGRRCNTDFPVSFSALWFFCALAFVPAVRKPSSTTQ